MFLLSELSVLLAPQRPVKFMAMRSEAHLTGASIDNPNAPHYAHYPTTPQELDFYKANKVDSPEGYNHCYPNNGLTLNIMFVKHYVRHTY